MTRHQLEKDVAHKLPLVTRGWRQLADGALAEFKISNSLAWGLIYLDRLGPQVRQVDLAAAIGIAPPSVVRVVDQLTSNGLVERRQDPDDKRSNLLSLTEMGEALVAKIEAPLGELRSALFADITEGDIATVLRVLDLLSKRIAERRK